MVYVPEIDWFFFTLYGQKVWISSYILVAVIATIVGGVYFFITAKKAKISTNDIVSLFFYIVLAQYVFAKWFFIFGPWGEEFGYSFIEKLVSPLDPTSGGQVFYGGFIGAFLAMWLFCKVKKYSFWKFGDLFAPAFAIIMAIARWSCFLSNDTCRGSETEFFISVVRDQATGVAIHPAPIYSSIYMLALFFILIRLRKKKHFEGFLVLFAFQYYAVARFLVEFIRIQEPVFWFMSASQVISVVVFGISYYIFRKKSKESSGKNRKSKRKKK